MDCEFLQRCPSLQALRKARPATLEAFWKTHGSRSEKRLHQRLDVLAGARALTEDIDTIAPLVLRVQSLVRQLQVLAQSLDVVQSRIQQLAASFEDYAFFRALPGAGRAFAPRLLASYGEDRSRWTSASALQCYSGIAPVTRQPVFWGHCTRGIGSSAGRPKSRRSNAALNVRDKEDKAQSYLDVSRSSLHHHYRHHRRLHLLHYVRQIQMSRRFRMGNL
jgi:Transposase IS116/IS110/IS902 family